MAANCPRIFNQPAGRHNKGSHHIGRTVIISDHTWNIFKPIQITQHLFTCNISMDKGPMSLTSTPANHDVPGIIPQQLQAPASMHSSCLAFFSHLIYLQSCRDMTSHQSSPRGKANIHGQISPVNTSGPIFKSCTALMFKTSYQKYGPPATGNALTISAIDNATNVFMVATITHPHSAENGPPLVYATPNRPAEQRNTASAHRMRAGRIRKHQTRRLKILYLP